MLKDAITKSDLSQTKTAVERARYGSIEEKREKIPITSLYKELLEASRKGYFHVLDFICNAYTAELEGIATLIISGVGNNNNNEENEENGEDGHRAPINAVMKLLEPLVDIERINTKVLLCIPDEFLRRNFINASNERFFHAVCFFTKARRIRRIAFETKRNALKTATDQEIALSAALGLIGNSVLPPLQQQQPLPIWRVLRCTAILKSGLRKGEECGRTCCGFRGHNHQRGNG
jgi:hypothetical protein